MISTTIEAKYDERIKKTMRFGLGYMTWFIAIENEVPEKLADYVL